ncbi:TetR/AcrR family transcriptional regulator [Streptomyces sp. LP11]|uniref:TetR/AcrR family transcriptional regulator n=1 Tax=Streptomyces pyxinicus TaxID=2970331 RepID=A0ABT2AX75_9ACTN|nr:TetR/AcrR family transcriptional regulator [Streptomyces sp. LP11]MCS0600751.1 TetR/AcrR family transcriptional regulator [Streptomyces sp. LP11]
MNENETRVGRPRSEAARASVLHAVDDLLIEEGYAAMSMKGIAARAGVSRQTVYRWWSTKAEILFEASVLDAVQELAVPPAETALDELVSYLQALAEFLTESPAGAAYRALLGEAQHDREVANLIASRDVVNESAKTVIERTVRSPVIGLEQASAELVGPLFFAVLSGRGTASLDLRSLAQRFLGAASR